MAMSNRFYEELEDQLSFDDLADDEIEALMQEYESGLRGEEFVNDDSLYCHFCEEFSDHDIAGCPELSPFPETGCSYPLDSDKDEAVNEIKEESPHGELDENGIWIPIDPYKSCFDAKGKEIKCHCMSKRDYSCYMCDVGREWPSHAWRPQRDDGEYNLAKRRKKRKPQRPKEYQNKPSVITTGNGDKLPGKPLSSLTDTKKYVNNPGSQYNYSQWADDDWGWYGSDRHYGSLYSTYDDSIEFHVSSMWNNRKEDEYVPDWGLYFDWSWKPWWRAEHVDWPDYGLPERWDIALEQLIVAIENAQNGLSVELGCIGGHGRTGTALAAINVILGCDPTEAINHVRDAHCHHAIETKRQEWWVHWVDSALNGTPCPKMPEPISFTGKTLPKTPYVNKQKTVIGDICAINGHFDLWISDLSDTSYDKCPIRDDCTFWHKDVASFEAGNFPAWKKVLGETKPGLAASDVIKGCLIPKRTHKEVPHSQTTKRGCKCDVCRYIEAGHGAFLRPVASKEGAEWDEEMDSLEVQARAVIGERKRRRILDRKKQELLNPKTDDWNEEEYVKVAQSDGSILEIRVAPTFSHKPPTVGDESKLRHGERRADFVWTQDEGWVWEGLSQLPVSLGA